MISYIYLLLSVLFNVASYLLYKSIANRQGDISWIIIFAFGLLLGVVNIYFFTKALKNIGLSVAYPIFSGACIALMILCSYIIFHERMSALNMIGAVVVIIGIYLLSV